MVVTKIPNYPWMYNFSTNLSMKPKAYIWMKNVLLSLKKHTYTQKYLSGNNEENTKYYM